MAKVREAIKMLEQALPGIPTGSDAYKAVLNAISSTAKFVPPSAEVPGVQKTALRDMQQGADKSAVMQSLMRSLSGGGAGQGAPGAQPAPAGAPGAPAMPG